MSTSNDPNCLVEGFARLEPARFSHLCISSSKKGNEIMKAVDDNNCQRENGRSPVALQAVSFILSSSSTTTATSFRTGDVTGRIRRQSACSTRLYNNAGGDSAEGSSSDSSSSPYWFAKVKTSSSSSSDDAQQSSLPKQDLPVEDITPSSSSDDLQQSSLPKQDLPVENNTPSSSSDDPQQSSLPKQDLPVEDITPSSSSDDLQQSSLPEQDLPVEGATPIPQPSQPQESQYLNKQDVSMDDTRTPIPPQPPLPLQPQPQQQSIIPPPPPSSPAKQQQQQQQQQHSKLVADTMSWTDIASTKRQTSNRQPASSSGFMPIFGAVPETKTPGAYNNKLYNQEARPKTPKRTKPRGASDQERDLADANIATERTKPKGASDQEKELSVANISTEPMQSGSSSYVPEAPTPPPPQMVFTTTTTTTDDIQSQGIVVPRSTIKVQEIDEDDEENDEDSSVSPIILEYLSKDDDDDDDGGDAASTAYMQTIVFPFRVDPNVRPEEQVGRENDAPMFTPAVKADIYKVLRSPNDPKRGGKAPAAAMSSGPPSQSSKNNKKGSPFAATLLAKVDEGTYAFCDRSLYDSMEQHKKGAEEDSSAAQQWDKLSKFTPLDDDQMLKAVACIGQTSPNSLAITKAFEAYLSQKAWGWGDYQASDFSVEFLIAFGNELSTRLDINHRIRSRKLSDQELVILSKPPFCNYVHPDTMRIFQNTWNDEDDDDKNSEGTKRKE